MKKCFECPESATQQVEVKSNGKFIVLPLCAFHADGHRKAEAWSRVIEELREAERIGDQRLAQKLDREQIQLLNDEDEFPEVIFE